MEGIIKNFSPKNKSLLVEIEGEPAWHKAEVIWNFTRNLKKEDKADLKLNENGDIVFLKKYSGEQESISDFEHQTSKPPKNDDTVIYDELQTVKDMLGSIIEDLSQIKKRQQDGGL